MTVLSKNINLRITPKNLFCFKKGNLQHLGHLIDNDKNCRCLDSPVFSDQDGLNVRMFREMFPFIQEITQQRRKRIPVERIVTVNDYTKVDIFTVTDPVIDLFPASLINHPESVSRKASDVGYIPTKYPLPSNKIYQPKV